MKIHEICIFCKYRGESACTHKQHHSLFRLDNVGATFSYYSAQPFSLPVGEETEKRIQECVIRLDNTVRFHEPTYGLAGIILLLESILDVNTAHYESLVRTGQNPPTAVHVRPDYPVQPSQQAANFNNSSVSTSSAQQPQRQPCPACIYLARDCLWNCQLAHYFESMFQPNVRDVQDFRDVCRSLFTRTSLDYNNTSQKRLKPAEKIQIEENTRGFDIQMLSTCKIYGTMGIVLSLVRRLLAVNNNIDILEGVNRSRQLVLQHGQNHPQVPPQYPAPTNLNPGGPPQQQQQQQLQLGVAKRSLEQRLPRPSNQPAGPYQRAGPWPQLQQPEIPLLEPSLPQPRLQQPVRFLHQRAGPWPQTRPLPQSQESVLPSQFQHLFARTNRSSTATSSQSLFHSQQPHYFRTGNSSSAAVVGQPDTHHEVPLGTTQFSADGKDTYWGKEEKQLNQGLPPDRVQMQGHQTRLLHHSWQGGPPQQQQQRQLQHGVAKRSLEEGESQMRQQRQRLPGPPNRPHQAVGASPRLQKPVPFQQPYPPAPFQSPPYHVPMPQLSALPFQPLLAGMNSSSSASSSQFQSQSHQQHYLSTDSSSSAAAGGQPHPHHRAPLDQHGFTGITFSGDEENIWWDTEQERLKQRYQQQPLQMQGHQTRPLPQSQPPAVPSQSQCQQQLASSSSSAAVVGQAHQHQQAPADPHELPIIPLLDDENTDEAQKQFNQGQQ